jgi:hypothetical protein
MNDRAFDPNAWFEAYRDAFGPVYKAQQEGLKTLERLARFNYAVAGDYLDTGLAQAEAAVSAKSPTELVGRGAELGTRLGEKLCGRVQEFVSIATDAQSAFAHFADETATRASAQVQAGSRRASRSSARAHP